MTTQLFDNNDLSFPAIEKVLEKAGFRIIDRDLARPWGGFLVIDETQTAAFIQTFFPELGVNFVKEQKLSPKILIVQPEKRLSWQYHLRRAEIWKLVAGVAGVVRSQTDTPTETQIMETGKTIVLETCERHRLVGLHGIGVVAEIWQHTDPAKPSDEQDIVRLADDFGR